MPFGEYKDFAEIVPQKPVYKLDWKYRYPQMSLEQKSHHIEKVKEWVKNNKNKHNDYVRISYWRIKQQAFEKLGGKCNNCNFSDPRALSVNHIEGQIKGKKITSRKLWKQIIDNKISKEKVSLLCMNCQFIYEYERGRTKLPEVKKYANGKIQEF